MGSISVNGIFVVLRGFVEDIRKRLLNVGGQQLEFFVRFSYARVSGNSCFNENLKNSSANSSFPSSFPSFFN